MTWRGIKFPAEPGDSGVLSDATDENLIIGNIAQILGTRRGERVNLPTFGCRLMDYVHEPLNGGVLQLLRNEILSAIGQWEPRVNLIRLSLSALENFGIKIALTLYLKESGGQINVDLKTTKEGVSA